MTRRPCMIACAILALGCNSGTTSSGAKLLDPPADDKAQAEVILKRHGIDGAIISLRTADDPWIATLAPKLNAESDAKKITMPSAYRIYKDGRVAKVD